MTVHDPLCPFPTSPARSAVRCECTLIARVVERERNQIADEVEMRCHQIHHDSNCPMCGPIIRLIRIEETE